MQENLFNPYCLACWVKFLAEDRHIRIFFLFSWKTGFDISSRLSTKETICIKCQILLCGKKQEKIIYFSLAEFAHRVVRVEVPTANDIIKLFKRIFFSDYKA